MLRRIEAQYGKAQRIWVMDRGVPTEEALAEMRQADPPVWYLVGARAGRAVAVLYPAGRDRGRVQEFKDDLQLRPIYHQLEERIEAHIFVAFIAYCLHVTLRARLKPLAPGPTPRAVLDKLAAVQMLDVHFPTTDGRTLILSRYTELNVEQKLLVNQLKLDLPSRPPPRITAPAAKPARAATQLL